MVWRAPDSKLTGFQERKRLGNQSSLQLNHRQAVRGQGQRKLAILKFEDFSDWK